jgi:hypothetical protein
MTEGTPGEMDVYTVPTNYHGLLPPHALSAVSAIPH